MVGLCLFGGAFSPPHRTHRRVVEAALERLSPDRLLIAPCRDHPIKGATDMPTAEHRLAMCRINFADLDPRLFKKGSLTLAQYLASSVERHSTTQAEATATMIFQGVTTHSAAPSLSLSLASSRSMTPLRPFA